jgi:GntR family transcriptional repressor for pyruvate dehydrogenase complex
VASPDAERFVRLFAADGAGRAPSDIAVRIRRAIASGDLAPGDRLPNERDLGGLFHVSRATLREALRLLEADGFVEVRRGVTGGAFVCLPTGDRAGSALGALIRFHQATAEHFAEFRLTFEPETARLAARRATPEQVAKLTETVARIGAASHPDVPWERFMDLDIAFHEQVAEASGNPIRLAVMLGVQAAFRESSLSIMSQDGPAWRTEQCRQLLAVADAIRQHKPRLAHHHMQRHLVSNTAVAAEMLSHPAPS